jgi:adenylate kinase family enzyme
MVGLATRAPHLYRILVNTRRVYRRAFAVLELETTPLLQWMTGASLLFFYKIEKPTVIYIKTSDEWCFARLKARGRGDDSDEYIKSRLSWFEWNVVPAISYFYDNKDYNFFEIDGERTIEEVHADLISKVESIS